jgi:hypothetical protein
MLERIAYHMEVQMATNRKGTSGKVASLAADTLFKSGSSQIARKLAGSALSQSGTNRQTDAEMEDLASKVLRSDRYAENTKILAGSVLSQSNKRR